MDNALKKQSIDSIEDMYLKEILNNTLSSSESHATISSTIWLIAMGRSLPRTLNPTIIEWMIWPMYPCW